MRDDIQARVMHRPGGVGGEFGGGADATAGRHGGKPDR